MSAADPPPKPPRPLTVSKFKPARASAAGPGACPASSHVHPHAFHSSTQDGSIHRPPRPLHTRLLQETRTTHVRTHRPPRRPRNPRLSLATTPPKAHLLRPFRPPSTHTPKTLQTLPSPHHRTHHPPVFKGKALKFNPPLLPGPRRDLQRGGFSQLGFAPY